MSILDLGAGAEAGLEQLLARQLTDEKFAEQKRATKATEDYRGKALEENTALRRTTQAGIDERAAAARQEQENNRISRTVSFRPIGSKVTEEEYGRETAAGVPQGVYKVEEVTPDHVNPQGETPETVDKGTRSITSRGTEAQIASEQRIKDADERAAKADADRDAARRVAEERENRLRQWGPPTVVIGDTSPNGTGAKVVRRTDIPEGGAAAPGTGAQRVSVSDAQTAGDTLDRIEKAYSADMVGPIEGRLNTARQYVPFVSNKKGYPEFAADIATLRNATIKAITGAQMSQPEAVRIMKQIPSETDKEDVFAAKVASTRANLKSILEHKGGAAGSAGAGGTARTGNIKSIVEVK